MAVRKLTTIHRLEELELKRETRKLLKAAGVNAQELVAEARNDVAWRVYLPGLSRKAEANQLTQHPGIGEARAKEIVQAVDKAGFILHEGEKSSNARRLLASVLGSPTVLLEHYEDLEDMAPEALTAADEFVRGVLPETELRVVELRFGSGLSLDECANELGIIHERVKQAEFKALARLRCGKNRSRLEVVTLYSREALSHRLTDLQSEIGKLKIELDSLRAGSPYPELRSEFAGVPVMDLDLSVRSFNCLMRAGIRTVDQLCRYTRGELLGIRNFGTQNADEVGQVLQGMGLELAAS